MAAVTMDVKMMKALLQGGAENLRKNCAQVNDLNVFPIPDGDTGDNMSLTFRGGIRELLKHDPQTVGEAAYFVANGMLMSARGNSGVILSQFFAGLGRGLRGLREASVQDLANAFREGVRLSYASVMTPTEGTILTVAREGVDYAASRVTEDSTLESFGEDFLLELGRSLKRTPELLSVLKEAGVVDSGGAGLYYIAEGMLQVLRGELSNLETEDEPKEETRVEGPDFSKFTENDVMEFGYCTEFILRLTRAKTDIDHFDVKVLIDYFTSIGGDSIVAVRDGSLVKIHVHTMTPERVLSYAHEYGEFLTLKIENMTLQHHETGFMGQAGKAPESGEEHPEQVSADPANRWRIERTEEKKRFGIVTVADGEGVIQTFKDLGADIVIEGGQGSNPSAADFVRAFAAVNAETVFVLPNNGNVVMAARQAAKLFPDADVRVIPDKSIGEGYAALTMFDPTSGDPDQIEQELLEATQGVETGLVSRAVRTTQVDGVSIRENDYIGFTSGKMYVSRETPSLSAEALAEALGVSAHEFMIAVYGKTASHEEREAFRRYMKEQYPRTELCEIDGGQDVYEFILILQ